jgi:hypothetical protein
MEAIKRKISFEEGIYRGSSATTVNFNTIVYGQMTADTFYLKIMLTQNMDDMGIYTDIPYISASTTPPDYSILQSKLAASGLTFPFMSNTQPASPTGYTYTGNMRVTGKQLNQYWAYGSTVTGATDSKKIDVKTYNKINQYVAGFDIHREAYTNYAGNVVNGRSRLTQQGEPNIYVFDTNDDVNIGTPNQTTGILYRDYTGQTRTVNDPLLGESIIPLTEMQYEAEGWNMTNTSLSAQTKEEYLFGITTPPTVFSDVFIDRGDTTVMEKHLRLSEVESLEHLERYGNGFYRIVK